MPEPTQQTLDKDTITQSRSSENKVPGHSMNSKKGGRKPPFLPDLASDQLFVLWKPVVCTYWKNGVPGGRRVGSRNVLSNTQFLIGGS